MVLGEVFTTVSSGLDLASCFVPGPIGVCLDVAANLCEGGAMLTKGAPLVSTVVQVASKTVKSAAFTMVGGKTVKLVGKVAKAKKGFELAQQVLNLRKAVQENEKVGKVITEGIQQVNKIIAKSN